MPGPRSTPPMRGVPRSYRRNFLTGQQLETPHEPPPECCCPISLDCSLVRSSTEAYAMRPQFLILVLALAGCGGGSTDLITPPPPPPAGFQVRVQADPEDAATAQALGWAQGIPDAEIRLTLKEGGGSPRVMRTDAAGVADFGQVPAGDYSAEVQRWLTAAERGTLPASDDANGWFAINAIRVAGAGSQATVSAPASRRRSLLVSEWAFNAAYNPSVGTYLYGGFLELYNNADTTVYLDGVILAEGYTHPYDIPAFPCSQVANLSNDPAGVWVGYFQHLPGSGREYALAPGAVAVIATDAIDHRPFFPNALDLRGADFEFVGDPDADNPSVPNAVDDGPRSHSGGHGLFWPKGAFVLAVAAPLDATVLPRMTEPSAQQYPQQRIPRQALLDAFSAVSSYPPPFPECPQLVHANIDRSPSRGRGTEEAIEYGYSLSRRATPLSSGGRPILQYTRTGAFDLIRTPRSPGRYP